MSLDNVLAVAGAAKDHFEALIFGLALSVVLMGVAATFIARLLHRYRWIAWVGLLIILYVAIKMTLDGVGAFTPIPEIPVPLHAARGSRSALNLVTLGAG